jgi:hypothetical protein
VLKNDAELLKKLSPSGTWRRGAFEVVRMDTGALLYSKVQTGVHFVDTPSQLDAFVKGL